MFTGIITDIGKVTRIVPLNKGMILRIETAYDPATIALGTSIACSGVCLTVVRLPKKTSNERWFEVEVWEEALRLTTIATWKPEKHINLERSLKFGAEMGGHLVSGHVDGQAEIIERKYEGDAVRFKLRVPEALAPFVAQKGSVALDGTALTVNRVNGSEFDVLLIRHSLNVTSWGERKTGDKVNIEVDHLARYLERLAQYWKSA